MLKTKLTNNEKLLLRLHRRESRVELIRLKADAVLMWNVGNSDEDVADVIGRSVRRVTLWRRAWNKARMSSVFSGHSDNHNASKLTKDQLGQIKDVLSKPPSDHGIPKEMWDVPTLKDYVSATFGVVYESHESYYFMLRFAGLSFKYPDTFDLRRNEQQIIERMAVIKQDVRLLKRRDDWEVFAVDEVKMQQEAVIRRCWLKKGERTVIKVDRKQQNQSYIGFLNQKNYTCHLYEMADKQNSKTVLIAMEQFLKEYPNKHIAIIWDNAAFHRSKEIKEQLKKGGIMERVHLIAMPPYAPDENPIEHVWNTAKQKVANLQRDSFEDTKKAFYDYVTERPFRYSL